jgi:tetratricopeptide (TPR) repeat protein
MGMSLTGACRFAAASFSVLVYAWAADCLTLKLTPEQRIAQVRDLDRAAQSAMAARQFPEAVKKMRAAACLAPDSSRVLYSLGMAEAASGDFMSARKSLQESDRLQPASPLPLAMQVRVNASLQDWDTLKANLRDAAHRFPNDADLHAGLARFLAENKQFELALAESLRAERTSAGASSLVEVAGLENTVGAYGEAVRNATRVENDVSQANTVRAAAAGISGLSYSGRGQQPEAVQHLQESIRLDPSRENSYLALAAVFEKAEQYPSAVQVLDQGRRAIPNSEALLLPLGLDLVRAERYKEGLAVLREVVHHSPDSDQAYLKIASACRNLADPEGELAALRALELHKPDYPQIHLLTARALLNFNQIDYPQVLAELDKAAKSTPTDADLFYLRGKAFLATNRTDEAVKAFRQAIELRPMEPGAYYQLGRLYQKLGQSALASEQMERVKVLQLPPSR